MNKNKKDRALHKYLSQFTDDYASVIASKERLSEAQVTSAIKKVRQKIHGGEFYFSIIDVGGNIDSACDEIFRGLELPVYKKPYGNDADKTRLANYLEQLIVEQRDIAKAIGVDPGDLSHFVTGFREVYAFNIYSIAKIHGKSASEVFEFLYGPNGIGQVFSKRNE